MPSLAAVTVESDLARRLRQSRVRITNAIEQRDRLILEALDAGASLREVAALVGLTHAGVRDILRRKGSA